MRQFLALTAAIVLLGACSELNPLSGTTASTPKDDVDNSTLPAEKEPQRPTRVVIARLENEPKAAPARRATAPSAPTKLTARGDIPKKGAETDKAGMPAPKALPAAEKELMAAIAARPGTETKGTSPSSQRATNANTGASELDRFVLDKIAPEVGPGRPVGQFDDAYSADRAFIAALTKPRTVPKRSRRSAFAKRVQARPTPRGRITDRPSPAVRLAAKPATPTPVTLAATGRSTASVPTKTAATVRSNPSNQTVATPPMSLPAKTPISAKPKTNSSALATLEGAEAADRRILNILGSE